MPLFKKDKPKPAAPEDMFKQDAENSGESYISNCPNCGATVTRAMYKCPQCKKILL
jgi:rubrerythrin